MSVLERLGKPMPVPLDPHSTKTRVGRGMVFLDEHFPEWQRSHMMLFLDVKNGNCCPLAIASRMSYSVAQEMLGLSNAQCRHMGFHIKRGETWEHLNAEWQRALSL